MNFKNPPLQHYFLRGGLFAVFVFGIWFDPLPAGEAEAPDFAREVLPILSNKCFVCHGPDAEKNEVRLDSYEGATVDLGGYKAIDPASPADSELISRIHDQEDPMPPQKAERQISATERDILTRWAKAGGKYSKHWAFVPPRKPEGNEMGIDSFVENQLKKEGYDMAPSADKPTLARRAALILTGLPPEPGQLNRFLSSDSPDAYGKLVDELIASSRFGEHQARYWLDAVRYGDTHGLHLDNRRGIFPYRDWVVKAFNDNLPFDEFSTWQIAGDLLPDPTLEQLTATGYVRMNPTTSEGGAIPEEFQAKNNFDRVENFGTVFLGMTLNCVRCHTHKYDPIVHEEYYKLMAFFNNTAEGPMDGNAYIYAPVLEVPATQEGWSNWEVLEKKQKTLLGRIDQLIKEKDLEIKAVEYANLTLNWKTENWRVTKDLPFSGGSPKEEDWKEVEGREEVGKEKFGQGEIAKWVRFRLTLPRPQSLIYKTNAGDQSTLHVSLECIPRMRKYTFLNQAAGSHVIEAKLQGLDGKMKAEIEILNPWETVAKSKKWNAAGELDRILMAGDPNAGLFPEAIQKEACALGNQLLEARSQFTTTLIAKDLPTPRTTKVLERGEYDLGIGESLDPGVFAVMNPFPKESPKNRLGLAQWLISPDQPLMGRVVVNRVWQSAFGEGIVRSPEDFGLQGRQPTHPGLLDYLAVDFREQGWNYKKLLKQIVMSRTFCQDSARRREIPDDPGNLMLARGPSFRLDAEVIRDTGLWASGLLESKMGGEGIKPYQPEGLWEALAHPASNTKDYTPDLDERVNERSLYVYWKRTSPHPMMTLFDAPSREVSCVRRSRGNTPLQSLGLLNEPQRLNMARAYASRLMKGEKTDQARLIKIFNAVACRPPSDLEKAACFTLLNQATDRYEAAPKDALALTKTDQATPGLAAWTQLVNAIMASDATILLY